MKLFVQRLTSDKDATISAIYLDDVFQCFGLEDEYREEKVGNGDENTAGCLLVGTGGRAGEGDMSIQSSRVAYKKLYSKVIEAAKQENLEIEYFDRDRKVDNDLKK